jgi:hypothetical protein
VRRSPSRGTWYGNVLRRHLRQQGFHPYPHEFLCYGEAYGYVDAAAEKAGAYYGFEFKSWNDWVGKGVAQCRCYARWFDYVILVAERDPLPRTKSYATAQRHGIGIWAARRTGTQEWEFRIKLEPRPQPVAPPRRASVVARFERAFVDARRREALRGPLDRWIGPSPDPLDGGPRLGGRHSETWSAVGPASDATFRGLPGSTTS